MNKLAALVLLAGLASCARHPSAGDPLALVNGESLSAADLEREMKMLGSKASERGQVLEDLIDQRLVLQEAERLGIALSTEELENQVALARAGTPAAEFEGSLKSRGIPYEAWRERIRRRSLYDEVVRRQIRSKIVVKPQDLKDYYWEHVTRFRRSPSVKLRQVFCKKRADAGKALAELRLGGNFAEVARRYSKAPEGPKGGDLGWVQRGALPKGLAQAAFELKKGKFSEIIATPYGWHILFAEDRKSSESLSLDQAASEILEALTREREQPLYRDWLGSLRLKADIKRLETTKGKK